ncbi:YggS family pyridoxal phosphate-dependent enzyme [Candidatus Woesearchaeota archaeon]|nr:YggS family pyridoxal phosphate-dependent enzyme [Candidatus Woesearchaeota archaeon]
MNIFDNLAELHKYIKKHRRAKEICLVVVTKQRSLDEIKEAIGAGAVHLGENRVQEAEKRQQAIAANVHWHMIGRLQSNKVKLAVQLFEYLHSIGSMKLAELVSKEAGKQGKKVKIFLQVNVSGEGSKQGFSEEEVIKVLPALKKLPHLDILGLMTMAPHAEAEKTRPVFKKLALLKEKLGLKHLSMGMSNDYQVALEEGADFIRIGTKVFARG